MRRRVSHKGVLFVGAWEGFRSCPYQDSVGVWTIGYGTTSAERPVGPGTPCISAQTALSYLRRSLNRKYLPAVPRARRMRQHERDALASFAYNLGPGAVLDASYSSLARRLKSSEGKAFHDRKRIYREEIPKWCNAGGHPLVGLVKRRKAELALAVYGDYSQHP